MNENVVEEVRIFVEDESKKPTAKYGYHPYKFHFIPVHDYAVKLSKKLKADLEIVEIAAWLHDIGSIIYGRENHHITGAEIAEKKLIQINYPLDRIQRIKNCILNHRGSINNHRSTLEEKIIADADSMSHFDNLGGLFQAALVYEKLDQKESMVSVLSKLKRSWNKLTFNESKRLIEPKYKAALILLK